MEITFVLFVTSKIQTERFVGGYLVLKPGPGLWTRTLDPGSGPWTRALTLEPDPENLDPEIPGPSNTWNLKNLDLEKPGINIELKKMSDFREFCFIKTMCNVIYCL